jgi:hypothetical protein
MATSLIASSTAAGTSSDIVVAGGAPVTLFLLPGSGINLPADANAVIQVKDSTAAYDYAGELTQANPIRQLSGPGTYRVVKQTSGTAYGVQQA